MLSQLQVNSLLLKQIIFEILVWNRDGLDVGLIAWVGSVRFDLWQVFFSQQGAIPITDLQGWDSQARQAHGAAGSLHLAFTKPVLAAVNHKHPPSPAGHATSLTHPCHWFLRRTWGAWVPLPLRHHRKASPSPPLPQTTRPRTPSPRSWAAPGEGDGNIEKLDGLGGKRCLEDTRSLSRSGSPRNPHSRAVSTPRPATYLLPLAQHTVGPSLYRAQQRVLDHAQHGAARPRCARLDWAALSWPRPGARWEGPRGSPPPAARRTAPRERPRAACSGAAGRSRALRAAGQPRSVELPGRRSGRGGLWERKGGGLGGEVMEDAEKCEESWSAGAGGFHLGEGGSLKEIKYKGGEELTEVCDTQRGGAPLSWNGKIVTSSFCFLIGRTKRDHSCCLLRRRSSLDVVSCG